LHLWAKPFRDALSPEDEWLGRVGWDVLSVEHHAVPGVEEPVEQRVDHLEGGGGGGGGGDWVRVTRGRPNPLLQGDRVNPITRSNPPGFSGSALSG